MKESPIVGMKKVSKTKWVAGSKLQAMLKDGYNVEINTHPEDNEEFIPTLITPNGIVGGRSCWSLATAKRTLNSLVYNYKAKK